MLPPLTDTASIWRSWSMSCVDSLEAFDLESLKIQDLIYTCLLLICIKQTWCRWRDNAYISFDPGHRQWFLISRSDAFHRRDMSSDSSSIAINGWLDVFWEPWSHEALLERWHCAWGKIVIFECPLHSCRASTSCYHTDEYTLVIEEQQNIYNFL